MLSFGFGWGHDFLATADQWHRDPARCASLHCVVIDADPPTRGAMTDATALIVNDPATSEVVKTMARALLDQWPPPTRNVHVFRFDPWPLTLHLVIGAVPDALRGLVGEFDSIHTDGLAVGTAAAPWDRSVFQAVARLSSQGAIVVGSTAAPDVMRGLHQAGFEAAPATSPHWAFHRVVRGPTYDRLARLGPRPTSSKKSIVIIGAGLAGAHVARALAHRSLKCTVLERHDAPACEASGGLAGIFHGTVHAGDGVHARLHRAAALHAAAAHQGAIATGVPGAIDGLLRLSDDSLETLRTLEASSGLPTTWARVVDSAEASRRSGVVFDRHAWLFAQGGWIDPRALVHWLLDHPAIHVYKRTDVGALMRDGDAWQVLDRQQRVIASGDAVVLANAADAARLWPHAGWPLQRSFGQSTLVPAHQPGLHVPALPVSGRGYAIPRDDGSVVCGASSHFEGTVAHGVDSNMRCGGKDTPLQRRDTRDNVDKLNQLTGATVDAAAASAFLRHMAWRVHTPDRLPLVGAVPTSGHGWSTDNVRHVKRERGLYVLAALGSRGLTLAPLMAEVVAASMLREPLPLELGLLNAVDAARYATRGRRSAPVVGNLPTQ